MTARAKSNLINVVVSTAAAAALALSAWSLTTVINHGDRLSRIEETRFTREDGAKMRNELVKELPPRWVVERLDLILDQTRKNSREIEDIKEYLRGGGR